MLSVVHEDDDVIAVGKPSGLYCDDVTELLKRMFQRRAAVSKGRVVPLTLMHRLDRDTSRVVLSARTPEALPKALGKAFSSHRPESSLPPSGLCHGPHLT